MPNTESTIGYEYLAQLENLPASTPAGVDEKQCRALTWLALAPAWPETLAAYMFPVDAINLATGPAAIDFIRGLVAEGWAVAGPGEPPLEGTWYWMDDAQRRYVIAAVLANPAQGISYLTAELRSCATTMRDALNSARANLAIARWLELALLPDASAVAERIGARVSEAIAQSEKAGGIYSSEAAGWTEAAVPLAEIFGGPIEVALAGAQRRMEVFRRDARDLRALKNYFQREDQEDAFESLISSGSDSAWALHYVGMGGIGKTMLVRRIRTALAKDRLAVGHVDFDRLNPNYPRRAPGLLLQSLASDLRLNSDPAIVKLFVSFDSEIQNVHQRLQGRYQEGEPPGGQVFYGLQRALGYFVEALRIIWKQGLRPLLILDTCEELERMRFDRAIPENLRFTFDLVERIHHEMPQLRVVFSGRRPLASHGFGWNWPGCSLPSRDYLRLFEITPFSAAEASSLLQQYRREERTVPAQAQAAILKQSRVRKVVAEGAPWLSRAQWTDGAAHTAALGELYYPYDLDLFARWASSPEGLDLEKLLAAGAHYYVKDRIVDRIGPILRPWLADLVLLGRFDQSLIQELTGLSERQIAPLWRAIVDQEWTELDRNAQAYEVWSVDPHLAERLLDYYREEDSLSLRCSRARVAPLLTLITLQRNFNDLSPAYFAACLRALSLDPGAAPASDQTDWWNRIEARMASEQRWDWANELTSSLLVESAPGTPLWPAILALQAAAHLHLSPESPYLSWEDVLATCDTYPDAAVRERLRFRARAGSLIAKSRAAGVTPLEGGESALALLRALDPAIRDDQLNATVIALVENVVEQLETVPRKQAQPIFEQLASLQSDLDRLLPASLHTFLLSLVARMQSAQPMMIGLGMLSSVDSNEQRWLDWRAPDNLHDRLELEACRLGSNVRSFTSPKIDNIDTDRLASALLIANLKSGLQPEQPAYTVPLDVPPPFTPLCNAHRAFPPSVGPWLEWMAATGAPDAAIRISNRILSDSLTPVDYRLAVQDSTLKVALRFRLYEEKIGIDAASSDPRATRIMSALSSPSDDAASAGERKRLIEDLRAEPVTDSEPRRAAENLLLMAMMQTIDDPGKGIPLYRQARKKFNTAKDELGELFCCAGLAGCYSMKGDLAGVRREIALLPQEWNPPGTTVNEWVGRLDSGPRALRPWRARVVACKTRMLESEEPSTLFSLWASQTYSYPVAQELQKMASPPADPFTAFVHLYEKAKPALRQSALGLLGLVAITFFFAFVYIVGNTGLRYFGIHWPVWKVIGVFCLILALIGAMPSFARQYVAFLCSALRFRRRVSRVEQAGSASGVTTELDPLTSACKVEERVCLGESSFTLFGVKTRITDTIGCDQPYVVQAARIHSAAMGHLPVENVIEIEDSAAAPWEAIFSLNGKNPGRYDEQKCSFRRALIKTPEAPWLPNPIPPTGRVVSWRLVTDRHSAQVWGTALKGRLTYAMEAPSIAGTLRRDDSIEILHILGRPAEITSGVGLQMQKSDSKDSAILLPASILSLAPRTRVCLVQSFPEDQHLRTTSDRYAANIARLLGAQIHSLGIPVVIMIPSLPEEQSRDVLASIADAIGRFPRAAGRALLAAVEQSRRKISKDQQPDAASATELACDLILYSTTQVGLHLEEPEAGRETIL